MKFITFNYNDTRKIGKLEDNMVYEILNHSSMLDVINEGNLSSLKFSKETYKLDDIELLSPIPNPRRNIICIGKNYIEHAMELKDKISRDVEIPDYPMYFSKFVNETVGMNGEVFSYSDEYKSLDYEVELAIIIGKKGKNIKKDDVKNYIFGYAIGNDLSMRELQTKHYQWNKGKSLDTHTAIGPAIVTVDEISYPPVLDIKAYVNDELRQSSSTKNLIFNINYIISDFSKNTTLLPGDIIFTGTPAGVGMGFSPTKYLFPGDVVKCEIEKIGKLINYIK
ncbi:MAG: fumarylacetoacetate hydrolase family protein [Clostridiales bacterium]|nr:fumarylacetoacetate hydrolase family protein [Clostridiales bacterium]